MEISFDPTKSARNISERGLSFERAAEFDFLHAIVLVDERREYGETRYRAFGRLDNRLHSLVFT